MSEEKVTIGHSHFDAFPMESDVKQSTEKIEGITNQLLAENISLNELIKELYYQMDEDDTIICKLCKRVNPQHEDCHFCPDREGRQDLMKRAIEVIDGDN